MALYDDKRFILSHIRHSFITCDDTGMCETVMLNEHHNRYPTESMYHHPFDYDSEEDLDYFGPCGEVEDEDELAKNGGGGESLSKGRISQDDIDFFKVTEVDYKSELVEDNPMNSFDIMSDSYEMGMRRRSNTAQRLEKLKKERKFQSKTKVITWKSPTKIVTVLDGPDSVPQEKRVVLNPTALGPEELALLEFDENEGVYYETVAYRKLLFPYLGDDDDDLETPTNEPQDDVLSPLSDLPDLPVTRSKPKDRRKSILTLQIERCPTAPVNPFNEFTRFDGLVSEGNAHTKRIRIFFRIFESNPEFQKTDFTRKLGLASSGIACGANWIEIVVLASARVSDLIGLICWNYTHLQLGPPLKPDPSMYALKIAEENGDVDNDFPALTASDDIKRYGFPYLALVELETNIVVTVNFDPDAVFSQITINSLATTLKEIIEQVKKKRPHLFKVIQGPLEAALRLELRSKPGIPLDLSSKISEYVDARAATKGGSGASHLAVNFSLKFTKTDENRKTSSGGLLDVPEGHEEIGSGSFKGSLKPPATAPIRANRSSIALFSLDASDTSNALTTTSTANSQLSRSFHRTRDWSQNMLDMMEAPLYQCFEVNAVHKLYNTPVELGISGSNVEIAPRTGSGAGGRSPNFADRLKARFNQMKAINIEVEDVVDCELIRRGKMELLGRHIFKLVYYNGNSHFKSLKFEADAVTVDDILFKLSNVMRMRTSPRRTEYQAIKSRKKSISTKIYLKSKMMLSSSSSSSDDDTTTGDDSTGPLSTGADSSVLSDPDGGGSSWISTLGRQKKADSSTSQNNKFRRFKSKP